MNSNIEPIGNFKAELSELVDVPWFESSTSSRSFRADRVMNEFLAFDYDAMSTVPFALEAFISQQNSEDF